MEKETIELHPSIVPFLTALKPLDNNKTLQASIALVNNNKVHESKTVHLNHTLMGNFCHGDKNKESQPEDMGNDACIKIAYHAKVSCCYLQQHIPIWNYLFHLLTKYIISILYLRIESNCQYKLHVELKTLSPKDLKT